MTLLRRVPVVLLCSLLTTPAWSQGGGGQRTPVRDQPAATAPAGSGLLSGRVTSAEGAPVRRAQIQLIGSDGGARKVATTDNEGRYSFPQLPPGRYTIRASKGGYVN